MALLHPALAEGQFSSRVVSIEPGYDSRTWYDGDLDGTNGRVTFSNCTRNDFVIAAYREDFGPDTEVGTRESIQCTYQADAMYIGDPKVGNYHWTLKSGSNITGDQTTYY